MKKPIVEVIKLDGDVMTGEGCNPYCNEVTSSGKTYCEPNCEEIGYCVECERHCTTEPCPKD